MAPIVNGWQIQEPKKPYGSLSVHIRINTQLYVLSWVVKKGKMYKKLHWFEVQTILNKVFMVTVYNKVQFSTLLVILVLVNAAGIMN